MSRASAEIGYTVQIWREGEHYIAHAMPIDLMSSGRTAEDARKAIDEAAHAFLATLADRDDWALVLEEAGYVYTNGCWKEPTWIGVERRMVSV